MKRFGAISIFFLCVLGLGCQSEKSEEGKNVALKTLRLSPAEKSGVEKGVFYWVEYGFSFPLPKGWSIETFPMEEGEEGWLLSAPEDGGVAELRVRRERPTFFAPEDGWVEKKREKWKIGDEKHEILLSEKKEEKRYRADLYLSREGFGLWVSIQATDTSKDRWKPWESVLSKVEQWTPVGPWGISREHYQLERFSESFFSALRAGKEDEIQKHFSELYPKRRDWEEWWEEWKKLQKTAEDRRIERAALVIRGNREAIMAIAFSWKVRKKPQGGEVWNTRKLAFRLNDREQEWKIVEPYAE